MGIPQLSEWISAGPFSVRAVGMEMGGSSVRPSHGGLSNSWKSARKFEILWAVFSRIHVDRVREKAAVGVRGCDWGKESDATGKLVL